MAPALARCCLWLVLVGALLVAGVPLSAGMLEVTSQAARSGDLGLRASLGGACTLPQTLTLEPPPPTTSGDFAACESVTVLGIEIAPPGATLSAGQVVVFGDGFSVAEGAGLAVSDAVASSTRFAYLTDALPGAHRVYRARFAVDLTGLVMAPGERVALLVGEAPDEGGEPVFSVDVRRAASLPENRLILAARRSDGAIEETPFGEELLLRGGWIDLEIAWQAAAGTGMLLASVDDGPFLGLALLDNDAVRLGRVHFGLVTGEGETSTGSIDLDDFASWAAIGGATVAGCPLFPFDNVWNAPVEGLPVHASSDAWIATIGGATGMHPDFGSGEWPPGSGAPIGIPWIDVPGDQPGVAVTFLYDDESDSGPYPIPADPPIEGGAEGTGDRHILLVDRGDCRLHELFDAHPQPDGSWTAGSGAIFDLLAHGLRPDGWTSADAAGLPILPGLVRYEEVAAGEIRHALRFTVPQTRRAYVWPGRHYASSLTGSEYPPMGQRFRLRADFELDGYSPHVQVILRALQVYGMLLADNGSAWYLSGAPSESWDNDVLRELRDVVGADFEAVDTSSLIVDPDSGQAAVALTADGFESGDLSSWADSTP